MATYSLSKEEQIKEILKCGKDPVYFINSYCRISHPIHGLIPFATYDFQQDLLDAFRDHRFNVILKARQMGISTIVAAYIIWLMLFHRDKNVLVIATKFSTAGNLVKKVKAMMRCLPEFMQISSISVDNRTSFELTNGSQIKASSTSGDAGRSEALSLLVLDEAAHIEGLGDLWTGLYPTISTGGRCIALSTPNGVGNWFHTIYSNAETGENDFSPIKLMWDLHPDRDQLWFDKETRNMSRRQIAQEFECNFNTSGDTVIHPDDIARIAATVVEPKHRTGFDRNFWIWEEYQPGSSYVLVADVARGDGADHSVFHVLKLETLEIVAEYHGKPTLDMFAQVLDTSGREYGSCMIVVENNNIGFSVLEKLIDKEYPNIYHSVKSSHEYVEQHVAESMTNSIPGFTTSMKTRPLIVAKLEEFIRNKLITIYSQRTLNEIKTFIWNNGKPQAMRGYNDDLVIALAIACWVRDTAFVANAKNIEYKKACIDSMIRSNTKLETQIRGQLGYKSGGTFDKIAEQEIIKQYQEFSWLYKG
jgi:hypothetical protein